MTRHAVDFPEDFEVFGESHSAFAPLGYSAAVRVDNLLFIGGSIGRLLDGTIPESIETQTEAAINRIAKILRLEGLTLSALVDVTSYHVDIHRHLPGFSKVKQRLISQPFPSWSMIRASALAVPGLLVEIHATAAHPDGSR